MGRAVTWGLSTENLTRRNRRSVKTTKTAAKITMDIIFRSQTRADSFFYFIWLSLKFLRKIYSPHNVNVLCLSSVGERRITKLLNFLS